MDTVLNQTDGHTEHTHHEFLEAFVDTFVQILNEIRVSDAVHGPPESILLREIRKTMRNV